MKLGELIEPLKSILPDRDFVLESLEATQIGFRHGETLGVLMTFRPSR